MIKIPLSLYVHLPWCVKKCPYCDFNSHSLRNDMPETSYIKALLRDLDQELPSLCEREVISIFFGGGTPSLFSAESFDYLLRQIEQRIKLSSDCEITLEANPGTIDQVKFKSYRSIGINRLSLGIQSFQSEKLASLGRIHDEIQAKLAIDVAQKAGFENINLDLMYGLPQQNLTDALADLTTAIQFKPSHISWYQLTLEPHTPFHRFPPVLPTDDQCWEIQKQGQHLLEANHYIPYEISAYSQPNCQCRHNRNYWEFGDYIGIGAGAHSKITHPTGEIVRKWKIKHPNAYLTATQFIAGEQRVTEKELPLEFMLNALRLYETIPLALFQKRTGLKPEIMREELNKAGSLKLLTLTKHTIRTTKKGKRYLNDLLTCFM